MPLDIRRGMVDYNLGKSGNMLRYPSWHGGLYVSNENANVVSVMQ